MESAQFLVFCLCRHSAPDMPLLLVQFQDLPDLYVERFIALPEPLGKIFMHSRF